MCLNNCMELCVEMYFKINILVESLALSLEFFTLKKCFINTWYRTTVLLPSNTYVHHVQCETYFMLLLKQQKKRNTEQERKSESEKEREREEMLKENP